MERRKPKFESYEDIIREIEELEKIGYSRLGNWSLGQICEHLGFYFKGSLEGFEFKAPWIIRILVGKPFRWWLMRREGYPDNSQTVPQSVPPENVDDHEAVMKIKELLSRLSSAKELHPSGLFGELTLDQWRMMHLHHAGHHLGFLVPNKS